MYKALLMWGDNLIKVMDLERVQPEIVIPINKVFNTHFMQTFEEMNDFDNETTLMSFNFRHKDSGHYYSIYELVGFEPTMRKSKPIDSPTQKSSTTKDEEEQK
jgi:hypothetical protein